MIRNLSYNNKEIKKEVNNAVGRAYTFMEIIKMGGTGSQKLIVGNASKQLMEHLKLDGNLNYCNIELRPDGIIIRFRSLLETIGWVVPYAKLSIYKNGNSLSLYSENNFMKLKTVNHQTLKQNFCVN